MSFSWQTVARSLGCPHLKASKESPGIGGSAPPLRAADQEQESFGTGSVYSSEEISCCSLRLKRGIEFKPRIPVISKLRSADNGAIHVIDCLVTELFQVGLSVNALWSRGVQDGKTMNIVAKQHLCRAIRQCGPSGFTRSIHAVESLL